MPGVKMEKIDDEVKTVSKTVEKQPVQSVPVDSAIGFYPINDLPSKYKLYPQGTIIYGRPLRVIEVKQLSQMGEENSGNVINSILRSATKGIKIEDILIADKVYILFWLRANTYKDSGYKVDFNCLKCKKPSSYSFALDALDVTYIKDDYDEETPIQLPICKDKIIMRYQRM